MKEKTKVTLKKIVLGIFMCLALVMLGMPAEEAMAATVTPTPQITAPGIDIGDGTTKTGSITIHKYTEGSTSGQEGTGSDTDPVPTDAAPLEKVKFTIYQVKDQAGLLAYYNGTATATAISVTDYLDTNGEVLSSLTSYRTVETGSDGIAAFTSLPLGIYLVVETDKPTAVTQAADPFLVSIPMTTEDGSSWLYDVHVFPKNSTTAGITLQKHDKAGSGIAGVTFVLQKYDSNATPNWTTIEANSTEADSTTKTNLVTNNLGKIVVEGLAAGTYRFIETSLGTNNVGYIMDGATEYEFTVHPNTQITYGNTTNKSVTISVVNEKPDIDKTVESRETANSYGNSADYSIGDIIKYKVEIDVPSNITQLRKFELTDTPTNLSDYTNTSGDNAISLINNADGNDVSTDVYTIKSDTTGKGFVITFHCDKMTAYAGKKLILTYSAKLEGTAATTGAGNPNTMQLVYDNKILPNDNSDGNPNDTPTASNLTTSTIEDGAIVFTFQIRVDKTDDEGNKLNGVKFDLYQQVADGTTGALENTAAEALGLITYSGSKWLRIAQDLTTTTDAKGINGQIVKKGLEAGKYALVETKTAPTQAPSGPNYNLLAKAVEVELNAECNVQMTTEKDTTNNKIVNNKITTKTVKIDGSEIQGTAEAEKSVTIINRQGFTLPTTGGAGGFLFTIIGCGIMIVGFVIFRKTSAKKSDAA